MDQNGLSSEDLEHVADILRAIVAAKDEIGQASDGAWIELETYLVRTEAAMRRFATKLADQTSRSLGPH